MVETPPKKPMEDTTLVPLASPAKQKKFRYWIFSFKGLARALSTGEITIEDLDLALIHFGKWRKYVFFDYQSDPNDPFKIWYPKDRAAERVEIRKKLHAALEKAESEVRIMWRDQSEKRTWKKVNFLLELHGYQPLAVDPNENYDKTKIILALRSREEKFIYIHD